MAQVSKGHAAITAPPQPPAQQSARMAAQTAAAEAAEKLLWFVIMG